MCLPLEGAATSRRRRRCSTTRIAAQVRRESNVAGGDPRQWIERARGGVARDLTRKRRAFAPRRTASSSSLMKSYQPIPVPDTRGRRATSSPRAPCRDAPRRARLRRRRALRRRARPAGTPRASPPPRSRPGCPLPSPYADSPSFPRPRRSLWRPPAAPPPFPHITGVAGASSTPLSPLAPASASALTPSPSRPVSLPRTLITIRPPPFPVDPAARPRVYRGQAQHRAQHPRRPRTPRRTRRGDTPHASRRRCHVPRPRPDGAVSRRPPPRVAARREAHVEGLEDDNAAAASFGVRAFGRVPEMTGVWVGDKKLGAVGVRVSGVCPRTAPRSTATRTCACSTTSSRADSRDAP